MIGRKSFISYIIFVCTSALFIIASSSFMNNSLKTDNASNQKKEKKYKVIDHPTPNLGEGTNSVEGIVLHNTEIPTIEESVFKLCNNKGNNRVSCHVVIDTDGTRYLLAPPTAITWHAGKSYLDGKEGANNFTIGIEFQGNTLVAPLTDDQIYSAIEYITPIVKKYNIKIENIVTHKMIRDAWIKHNPGKKAYTKDDITDKEYKRFIRIFKENFK